MQVDCEGAGRAAFGGELRVGVAQVRGDTEAQARRAHRRLERPVVAAPFGAMLGDDSGNGTERLRRGGHAHRLARSDAGTHRTGARREGRCPAGLS